MNYISKIKIYKISIMLVIIALLTGVSLSIIQIVRSAALNPGHAWTELDDAALPIANGGTGQTTANTAFNAWAPSQTGNSGKFLTTDASNSSWGTPTGAGTTTRMIFSGRSSASLTADAICNPTGHSVCTTIASSEATIGVFIPFNGTIKNLYGYISANQASGDVCNFRVLKATDCTGSFSATDLFCSVSDVSQSCSNTTAEVNITSGECLSFFFEEPTGSCSGNVSWSFELEY